jgi:predicted transcriptional regulator
VLTDLQRQVLELLAGEAPGASTETLLAKLGVSVQDLSREVKPLAKRGFVVAWVASLSGGWEITARGRDVLQS